MSAETMKATTQRPAWTVSYTSAVSDRCTWQNSAVLGPPGVIQLTFIMGSITVLEHITHEDKYATACGPWLDFPNSGIYFACPEDNQGVSYPGGAGGFQGLPTVIVQMYLKGWRAHLVPAVFPALNLHRGANPTGKSRAAGKSTGYSSLQKRSGFSDRALAAKWSFVLQARKLFPVVWSSHFRKRALAKYGIKDILIVIITSTCPLKHNSKYQLKPHTPGGNGARTWFDATTWAVSVTSWGQFCMSSCSAIEVKGLHSAI